MTRTIFTCEKCKQEWDTRSKECPQQVNIACRINYGHTYHDFRHEIGNDILSMNWCRPCVDALNLHKPREKQKPTLDASCPAPNPTTEEMLINLLETLGFTREH